MLSYFRCADDFFRIKGIVNWFVRHSAISTIKHKHKLASRKTVFEKYGTDLTFTSREGRIISLISRHEVTVLRKEYLKKPNIDWIKKNDQIQDTSQPLRSRVDLVCDPNFKSRKDRT
ncbi:MAG: hypothetical protein JSS98_07825 [Bacteroidetes bacterium]|nr:hypothetical protein [Bacteroidota bacterium]